MKRSAAALLVIVCCLEPMLWAGLGSHKTMYVGGTMSSIKEGTEGESSAKDEKVFVFDYGKGGKLTIPYDRVDSLEYGQKAGRRVGVAFMVNPIFIFSKKRRHFLTIGYNDANDKQQAVVLELGKDVIRVTLATMEARTGKKIEYQDAEAKNAGRGN
jgi:hypothetical protein